MLVVTIADQNGNVLGRYDIAEDLESLDEEFWDANEWAFDVAADIVHFAIKLGVPMQAIGNDKP